MQQTGFNESRPEIKIHPLSSPLLHYADAKAKAKATEVVGVEVAGVEVANDTDQRGSPGPAAGSFGHMSQEVADAADADADDDLFGNDEAVAAAAAAPSAAAVSIAALQAQLAQAESCDGVRRSIMQFTMPRSFGILEKLSYVSRRYA